MNYDGLINKMRVVPKKSIRILLAILGSIAALIGIFIVVCMVTWHFTYTLGGTLFLSIGATKDEVITNMVEHHIFEVRVSPDSNISVRAPNEVFRLKGGEGIEYLSPVWITMGTGDLKFKHELPIPAQINIGFTNGVVTFLLLPSIPEVGRYYKSMFWEGESEDKVLDQIGILLKEHPGSEAHNIIPGDSDLILDSNYPAWEFVKSANGELIVQRRNTSEDKMKLKQYNVWTFAVHRLAGHDVYTLYFGDGRLKKIVCRKILVPIISL